MAATVSHPNRTHEVLSGFWLEPSRRHRGCWWYEAITEVHGCGVRPTMKKHEGALHRPGSCTSERVSNSTQGLGCSISLSSQRVTDSTCSFGPVQIRTIGCTKFQRRPVTSCRIVTRSVRHHGVCCPKREFAGFCSMRPIVSVGRSSLEHPRRLHARYVGSQPRYEWRAE